MTDDQQPEALLLAEWLEEAAGDYTAWDKRLGYTSATELRRQHAEIDRLTAERDMYKSASDDFSEKTDWVQKSAQPSELGQHRADVLRSRIERLTAERDALREAIKVSCDDEREQFWEAGPGGGCQRALDAEHERDALRAELDALKRQEPVAVVVQCAAYEDGTFNPNNELNWAGRNCENDFPTGTLLYAAPVPSEPPTGYVSTVDVEKLLCAKLGREWSAGGISIASLVDELAAAPQPESKK